MKRVHLLTVLLLNAIVAGHAMAMDINGQIVLTGSGAFKLTPEEAVIYFIPNIDYIKAPPIDTTVNMVKKQFEPSVIVVSPGSRITMPNNDTVKHNAFSPNKPNDFDLEMYGNGEEKTVTINSPGIIRVYCNVHYHMKADILVLDTPYVVRPNALGEFTLSDLPNASGTLHIWYEQSNPIELAITAIKNQSHTIPLEVSRRRIPQHLNKFGESYRKVRPD